LDSDGNPGRGVDRAARGPCIPKNRFVGRNQIPRRRPNPKSDSEIDVAEGSLITLAAGCDECRNRSPKSERRRKIGIVFPPGPADDVGRAAERLPQPRGGRRSRAGKGCRGMAARTPLPRRREENTIRDRRPTAVPPSRSRADRDREHKFPAASADDRDTVAAGADRRGPEDLSTVATSPLGTPAAIPAGGDVAHETRRSSGRHLARASALSGNW